MIKCVVKHLGFPGSVAVAFSNYKSQFGLPMPINSFILVFTYLRSSLEIGKWFFEVRSDFFTFGHCASAIACIT